MLLLAIALILAALISFLEGMLPEESKPNVEDVATEESEGELLQICTMCW